jgi:6-phosphogluconate dehydrogenase (decarboxylating)
MDIGMVGLGKMGAIVAQRVLMGGVITGMGTRRRKSNKLLVN